MVKTRIAVCSAIGFAVMLALGSVPSNALPADVFIFIIEAPPGNWTIHLANPKGPDICATMSLPICDGEHFRWEVKGGGLNAGEKVVILAAGVAPDCFGGKTTWEIIGPTDDEASPVPTYSATCPSSKYGVLWPYDIQYWELDGKDWVMRVETDPRGIVH